MRGVVVMGPEASGTGYVRNLLVAAGAYLVDPYKAEDFRGVPLVKVSLPNGRDWPGLEKTLGWIDVNDPFVVVTSRRWDASLPSQVRANHTKTEWEALGNVRRSYTFAFSEIARFNVPFVLASYEAFADASYREFIAGMALGEYVVPGAATDFGFKDGNAKYLV